jgi:hypothetical protein
LGKVKLILPLPSNVTHSLTDSIRTFVLPALVFYIEVSANSQIKEFYYFSPCLAGADLFILTTHQLPTGASGVRMQAFFY